MYIIIETQEAVVSIELSAVVAFPKS